MKILHLGTAACVALLVAGCAGGSRSTIPPAATGDRAMTGHDGAASSMRGKATLTVRIRIPKRRHGRGARSISAATKGLAMSFSGPSSFTQAIDLTPSNPDCSGSPLSCTIAVPLQAGAYTASVSTYDQVPEDGFPQGNLLAFASKVAITVRPGRSNTFGVTLDGVPASIVVGGFPSADYGTAFPPTAFSVTVRDADDDTIVGTYATPVTLTDGDTSGATAIATSGADHPPTNELLSSSDAAIGYTGKAVGPITIGASAGAATGSGVLAVVLPVFVADFNADAVEEIPPGCTSATCVITLGTSFGGPTAVAIDASGNVFVADYGATAIEEIHAVNGSIPASPSITPLGSGLAEPFDVAVDASGDVFVADNGNNAIKEIVAVNGSVPASPTIRTLGSGFSQPVGVAVDGAGNVFVADYLNDAVKELVAVGGSVPASPTIRTLSSTFDGPTGVTVDRSGNVFVTDNGNNAVKELVAVGGSVPASPTIETLGSGFDGPYRVAVDGSGNVYVADNGNKEVKEILAAGGSVPASPTISVLGGGFTRPLGVAVP